MLRLAGWTEQVLEARVRGVGWKALLASGLLIVIVLAAAFWLITEDQERRYNADLDRQLLTAARMVRAALRPGWDDLDAGDAAGLVHSLREDGAAVVIMSAEGDVLVDTTTAGLAGTLLDEPEVQRALLVGWGSATRPLPGEFHSSRLVAVRVGSDDSTLGVVWLARPTWTIETGTHSLGDLIAAVGAVALVSTLLLTVVLTRLRTRLLRRLTETARSLSAGDLSAEADIAGSDEYAALSAALNQTRRRLAQQVVTIDRQRLTLESLLNQLHEGVVVVGPEGHVALINPAAVRLLNLAAQGELDCRRMIGLPLERCVPQHSLQQMLAGQRRAAAADGNEREATSASGGPAGGAEYDQETRLRLRGPAGELHLLARVSDVLLPGDATGPDEPAVGRVLVLTDITELARIIHVKADFVANASHELRTPLAAIRAAIETLLHMNPAEAVEAGRRFLNTVERQSRRLEALVTDLLDLSRLESPTARFEPEELSIRKELDELRGRFAERLESKGLSWEGLESAAAGGVVVADRHLLRLVLDNLVDNAIKFTPAGGHVRVECAAGPGWACFAVVDDGCGIPEAEQERVFERFYQVERGRSGAEQGTGLGLSIVRHAVAALGGTVALSGAPGQGTRVLVKFPQPQRSAASAAR